MRRGLIAVSVLGCLLTLHVSGYIPSVLEAGAGLRGSSSSVQSSQPTTADRAVQEGSAIGDGLGTLGLVKRPARGDYVYEVHGQLDVDAATHRLPRQRLVAHYAEEILDAQSVRYIVSGSDGSRFELIWGPDRVLRTFDYAGEETQCRYEPPLIEFPIPIRSASLDEQQWFRRECLGSRKVTVLGLESVVVLERNWTAWRIRTVQEFEFESRLTGRSVEEAWVSDELGVPVRRRVMSRSATSAFAFRSEHVHELKKFPSAAGRSG